MSNDGSSWLNTFQCTGKSFEVYAPVGQIGIDGHRLGANVDHRLEGSPKRHVGNQNNIAFAHSNSSQSQLQSIRTVGTGHSMSNLQLVLQLGLKRRNLTPPYELSIEGHFVELCHQRRMEARLQTLQVDKGNVDFDSPRTTVPGQADRLYASQ